VNSEDEGYDEDGERLESPQRRVFVLLVSINFQSTSQWWGTTQIQSNLISSVLYSVYSCTHSATATSLSVQIADLPVALCINNTTHRIRLSYER